MKLKIQEHHYLNGTLHYRYFGILATTISMGYGYEEWIYPKYNTHDRCYYNRGKLVGFEMDDNKKYYNI